MLRALRVRVVTVAFASSLLAVVATPGCKDPVTPPELIVAAVSPASGPLAGGASVTITGTNFIDVTGVTIAGNRLGSRIVVSPTQITGTTPAATNAGAADVVVTSSTHGNGTCSGCFTYNPPVTVSGVSPANGPLAGGTNVTVTGTSFTNVTSVTVGGAELGSRTVLSTTQITGTTPGSSTPGIQDVVVISSSHGNGTCSGCFTYNPHVTVTGVSPAIGPLRGGTSVTITGTNFANATSVTIAGTELVTRTVLNSTQISGTTPAATAPVRGDVVVTSSTHGSATCTGCFDYVPSGGTAVAAGQWHTCGLTTDGAAYCWGQNGGQLGNGSTTDSPVPLAVSGGLSFTALTTGNAHTCGLASSGVAYCWGSMSPLYPLDDVPVAIPGGLSFIALASGNAHACGVTTSGAAYCWGLGGDGQFGNGSNTDSPIPVAVSGGLTFSALAGGDGHTCGLTTSGAAYCWGSNGFGQLGDGSGTDSYIPVAVSGGLTFNALASGYNHTCARTGAGALYCWGEPAGSSTPVAVPGGFTFTVFATGNAHTCGLTSSGAAYCWGYSRYGALGNGSTPSSSIPIAVSGGLTFTALDAGMDHTCALASSGAAYCWGYNGYGQLGNGSTSPIDGSSPVPVPVVRWP